MSDGEPGATLPNAVSPNSNPPEVNLAWQSPSSRQEGAADEGATDNQDAPLGLKPGTALEDQGERDLQAEVGRCKQKYRSKTLARELLVFYLQEQSDAYFLARDTAGYLGFLVLCLYAWLIGRGYGNSGEGYEMTASISSKVTSAEWNAPGGREPSIMKTYEAGDLGEVSDFWKFIDSDAGLWGVLTEELVGDQPCPSAESNRTYCKAKGFMNGNNYLLGGTVRFSLFNSQTRECPNLSQYLHGNESHFDQFWKPCHHGGDMLDRRDREEPKDPRCRSGDTFLGSKGYHGWRFWRSPDQLVDYPGIALYHSSFGAGSRPSYVEGKFESYSLDGAYVFDLKVGNKTRMQEKLECMKESNWINDATRGVMVSMMWYNPTLHLFNHMELLTEIHPSGSFSSLQRDTVFEYQRFTGRILVLWVLIGIGTISILVGVIWRIAYRLRTGVGREWFGRFIDCTIILSVAHLCSIRTVFWALPDLEFIVGPNTHASIFDLPQEEQQGALDFAIHQRLVNYSHASQFIAATPAITVFAMIVLFIRYCHHNSYCNLLTKALLYSLSPLLGLAVSSFVLLLGFTVMGMTLYGHSMEEYRSFSRAFRSLCMLIVLGEGSYDDLQAKNRRMTTFFFTSVLFVMWLVVLNLVIAVLNDGYTLARQEQTESLDTLMDYLKGRKPVYWLMEFMRRDPKALGMGLRARRKSPVQWHCIGEYIAEARAENRSTRWCNPVAPNIKGVHLDHVLQALKYRDTGEATEHRSRRMKRWGILDMGLPVTDRELYHETPWTMEKFIEQFEACHNNEVNKNPKRANRAKAVAEALWDSFGYSVDSVRVSRQHYNRDRKEVQGGSVAPEREVEESEGGQGRVAQEKVAGGGSAENPELGSPNRQTVHSAPPGGSPRRSENHPLTGGPGAVPRLQESRGRSGDRELNEQMKVMSDRMDQLFTALDRIETELSCQRNPRTRAELTEADPGAPTAG